jgi:hypothetical protein
MKPPICRLCGAAHWSRDPHQWSKSADTAKPLRQSDEKTVVPQASQAVARVAQALGVDLATLDEASFKAAYDAYHAEYDIPGTA